MLFRDLVPRMSVLLAIVSSCGTCGMLFAADAGAAKERPNFIVINIDDLGYGDIGPFGSDNRTPHLDRMAREGRLLKSHYGHPVCSPSRAALMTGCYPKRVLPIPHVLFPASATGLHPEEQTIAETLRAAGYATACIGKWHLGDQAVFLPTQQGFDFYFGIPYSNDMGTAAEGSKSNLGRPLPQPKPADRQAGDEYGLRGNAQPPLPLVRNDKVVGRVGIAGQAAFTRDYTQAATRFIQDNRDQPFFLYLPHSAVHFPLYPSEEFRGKSPHGLLGDWVEEVDWSVGQVLETIRELKLDHKTLVIFTSDNGGSLPHGSVNTPLRGSKGSTWEGGIRVCTIAWWPGQIPAGTETSAMTSMMDIHPTFAALAGATLPENRKLDGVNQWPVLAGDPEQSPRDEFFYFRGFQLEAVRKGPWKLHLAVDRGRGQQAMAVPQLFHLGEDIGETKNVADQHPDVVQKLQALAMSIDGDLGLSQLGPGCRPLGRVAHPEPMIAHDGKVRADAIGEQAVFPQGK